MTAIRYELCKAIHAIYISRDATEQVRAGDFSILDRFTLSAEERTAIEAKDLVTLYRLGAHPILVFHLSAVLNPRETYIREVVPNLAGIPNPFYDYYSRRAAATADVADDATVTEASDAAETPSGKA